MPFNQFDEKTSSTDIYSQFKASSEEHLLARKRMDVPAFYPSDAAMISVRSLHSKMQQKASSDAPPYIGLNTDFLELSPTDMDHFPYQRFYRGQATSLLPIVLEREAGFHIRPTVPPTYYPLVAGSSVYAPDAASLYCFQYPCGTIFPCYPTEIRNAPCVNISI